MKMDFRKRNARTRVCRIDHCLIRQIERVWQGVGGIHWVNTRKYAVQQWEIKD